MSSVAALLALCGVVPKEDDRVELLPNGEVVFYRDSDHRYFRLVDRDGKGCKDTLYAVSSVLGVLDKPGLLSWVRTVTLQGQNYWDVRDTAGTRGTSIHDAAEALAKEGRRPILADFPEEDRGFVQALASFWLDYEPQVVATEVVVASVEHGFAGRYDLLTQGTERVLWDFKTSKRVYPVENFCQLAAYEGASVECGYPPTDAQRIIRLGEDGSYEVAESCASYADFLSILATFKASKRLEKEHKAALKAAA